MMLRASSPFVSHWKWQRFERFVMCLPPHPRLLSIPRAPFLPERKSRREYSPSLLSNFRERQSRKYMEWQEKERPESFRKVLISCLDSCSTILLRRTILLLQE